MAVRPPLLRPVSQSENLTSLFLGLLYGLENLPRAFVVTIISYDALRLMGSESNASYMLAFAAIGSLLVTLNSGRLIRLMSRKWVFTLAVVGLGMAGVLTMWGDPWLFTLGLFFRNAGAGLTLVILSLYVLDFVPQKDLVQAESRRMFFAGAVWLLAPTAGVFVWHAFGPAIAYLMTVPAAGLLLAVFWALRLREADNVDAEPTKARVNTREAMRRYFNDPNLTIAYFIAVSRSVFYVSIFTYVPMYVVSAGLDEALGGYFISASTLVLFAGPFLTRFVPMVGVRRLIMCSFFIAAFCLIIAGNLTTNQAYFVFGLLLASTVSASVLDIVGNLPFMRLVKPEERTEMSVVFYTWRDLSFALTPLFGGFIISLGGIEAVFVVLGAMFCLMTGLTFALPRIAMSNDARPAI